MFLLMTKCAPFRIANPKDPYYRRLSAVDKKSFWKIFSNFGIEDSFKDLFEHLVDKDPNLRFTIEDIKNH